MKYFCYLIILQINSIYIIIFILFYNNSIFIAYTNFNHIVTSITLLLLFVSFLKTDLLFNKPFLFFSPLSFYSFVVICCLCFLRCSSNILKSLYSTLNSLSSFIIISYCWFLVSSSSSTSSSYLSWMLISKVTMLPVSLTARCLDRMNASIELVMFSYTNVVSILALIKTGLPSLNLSLSTTIVLMLKFRSTSIFLLKMLKYYLPDVNLLISLSRALLNGSNNL